MFPNLDAEQARKRHSNAFVALELGISRQAYEHKKRVGAFKLAEITHLLSMYGGDFEYLFTPDETVALEKREVYA